MLGVHTAGIELPVGDVQAATFRERKLGHDGALARTAFTDDDGTVGGLQRAGEDFRSAVRVDVDLDRDRMSSEITGRSGCASTKPGLRAAAVA